MYFYYKKKVEIKVKNSKLENAILLSEIAINTNNEKINYYFFFPRMKGCLFENYARAFLRSDPYNYEKSCEKQGYEIFADLWHIVIDC